MGLVSPILSTYRVGPRTVLVTNVRVVVSNGVTSAIFQRYSVDMRPYRDEISTGSKGIFYSAGHCVTKFGFVRRFLGAETIGKDTAMTVICRGDQVQGAVVLNVLRRSVFLVRGKITVTDRYVLLEGSTVWDNGFIYYPWRFSFLLRQNGYRFLIDWKCYVGNFVVYR